MPVAYQDTPSPNSAYQVAQQQGLVSGGGGGGGSPTFSPLQGLQGLNVYFGSSVGRFPRVGLDPYADLGIRYMTARSDNLKSLRDAQALIFTPSIYNRLLREAAAMDIGNLTPSSAQSLWASLIDFSAQAYAAGQKITPWAVLKMYGKAAAAAARGGGGGGGGPFSGTRTTTSTAVDLTDPKTAKALLDAVMIEGTGEAASDKEVRAFIKALNAEEEEHPLVTTTSTTYQAGIPTSSSSKTKGGFPAPAKQEFAGERTRQNKKYGAFQVAGPLFDAFLQLIGGTGG